MALITLLTDFGERDYDVGIFKGYLYSASPSSKVIDISHTIPPYDIVTGGFFLKNIFRQFPQGTIHIARVYEQGLSSQRILAAKFQNHFFIAPDNGILTLVFDDKPDLMVEVDIKQAKLDTIDEYYCRVVKEITFNNNIGSIGVATQKYLERKAMIPVIQADRIVGTVAYIDNFGNAITNIHKDEVERIAKGKKFSINYKKNDFLDTIVQNYSDVPLSYSLARFNTLGFLELCINCGHAGDLLGLMKGDSIQVIFEA